MAPNSCFPAAPSVIILGHRLVDPVEQQGKAHITSIGTDPLRPERPRAR